MNDQNGSNVNALRSLPAVDALLNTDAAQALIATYGRPAALDMLRTVLDQTRVGLRTGQVTAADPDALLDRAAERLRAHFRPTLHPVINATGVIIHTNLGRAPLSVSAQDALLGVAAGYSTLEYDPVSGKRGSRLTHSERILSEVTGAEAAIAVNNNAAALVLTLSALALDREVIISRGQLVEIGGGFRIPEVMTESGARLVEVGTTNRTRPTDYDNAITEDTALLLRAHSSNFKQLGFVQETSLADMAAVAQRHGVHVVDDLGSGALLDTAAYGLDHEPTVQESLAAGVDLVCFSGDKLLGGPQAGIIVGKKALVDRLKRHPLARAVRADKLCIAALTATFDHYRRGEALEKIPVWQMIARPLAEIIAAAESWAAQVGGDVIPGESAVGGGSLPGTTLPTALLALTVSSPDSFAEALRTADTPVIPRIADGRVVFDPRTVLPGQESALLATVGALLQTL